MTIVSDPHLEHHGLWDSNSQSSGEDPPELPIPSYCVNHVWPHAVSRWDSISLNQDPPCTDLGGIICLFTISTEGTLGQGHVNANR